MWISGHAKPQGIPTNRTMAREAVGVVGARSRRGIFRTRSTWPRWTRPWRRKHVGAQTAPDTPWSAAVLGELIAAHTDFPAASSTS